VRGSQLNVLGEDAKFARHVVSHLDAYLSATQLGITLASLSLGWIGEPFLARMLEPFFALAGVTAPAVIHGVSFSLAFAIITFLHIVLGELAPKSLAIRKSVPTTLWVIKPLGLFYTLFKPAIWVLNGAANWLLRRILGVDPVGESERAHSEEELRLLLAESGQAHELSVRGAQISANAFNLRRLTARDIMTPRPEVVFLDLEDSFASNLRLVKATGHTRFPLCREHLDRALGVVHVKDIITLQDEPAPNLESIKRELLMVPEMMLLENLLDLFLGKHAHLALAVDEYGGVAGIVTLENVIEEVVGEIQDEFDTEGAEFEARGEGEFSVRGSLGLHELRALAQLELQSTEVSTIGGYVTQLFGRLPQTGEKVRIEDYLVTVTKAGPARCGSCILKRPRARSPNESPAPRTGPGLPPLKVA
ncbi:MAG: HlyC/CorC family transporter, partial [Chthoniobacterales bacterium]|nr:HlyC/CorC family transporter [Chthoniobacterales bacterium]